MDNLDEILNKLDVDIDVKTRLKQHLLRTIEGSKDAYITPIGREHTPEKLLSDFDKVFESNKTKMNSVLLDLEFSNRDKYGPRSLAKPWSERKDSLLESFGTEKDGNLMIRPLKGIGRLRPISIEKALELLKNDTNSGLPYYTKKGKIKERVSLKFVVLLSRKDPCILFTRTQEQQKTRNVWGYPMADTLNEMMFYSPLLAQQKKLNYRAAINTPDVVDARLTELINRAVKSGSKLVSIDFVAYDQTAKSLLQWNAFEYVKSSFQPSCSSKIDYIRERFSSIGILTPDGVLKGKHGIPSGSTFTNEIGSIIQATIGMSNQYVTESDFQVQGDDGVYLVPDDKVDELKDSFRLFGLEVNDDKSYVSGNYAIYLQNLYHVDYENNGLIGGIYPVYRALNRIVYQERWSDFEDFGIIGKDYYSIRTICILEIGRAHV